MENDAAVAAEVEQNTEAWRQIKCGYVGASRISDVMAKPRSKGQKESSTRKAYMAQIITERLTGKPMEGQFESWDTRRGIELEPFARAEYEQETGLTVITTGFILHPSIPLAGASPDGLVGEIGLVQFKAPRPHVHLDYILAGIVPTEYRPQMQFEMAVTGRKWNDFCSYCETMPAHLRLFITRLERDDAEIEEIQQEVIKFNAEVDEIIARLPKRA